MNRLTEILDHKRKTLEPVRARRAELRDAALRRNEFRSFAGRARGRRWPDAVIDRRGQARVAVGRSHRREL